MTDFLSFPLPVLLLLLGLFALFLSIGGTIAGSTAPEGKEKLVGIAGTLLIISGIAIFIWQPEVTPPLPTPTAADTAALESLTPTQTATAVPLTNTPTAAADTAVPSPETPSPTPSPTSAPTTEPEPTPDEIIQIASTGGDNWVYAGPDKINARLGAMQLDEKGVVLGKDKWENWVKVKTERDVTGWVELEKVEFVVGTLPEVAVAWPPSTTSVASTTTSSGSGQCMAVTLASQDWPSKEFDDIWIRWANVPDDVHMIRIRVDGNVNGASLPLIYPTSSDLESDEYYIGYWKFIERNFSTGVTFTYSLSALDEGNHVLCTVTGQFDQ